MEEILTYNSWSVVDNYLLKCQMSHQNIVNRIKTTEYSEDSTIISISIFITPTSLRARYTT